MHAGGHQLKCGDVISGTVSSPAQGADNSPAHGGDNSPADNSPAELWEHVPTPSKHTGAELSAMLDCTGCHALPLSNN